MGKIKFKNGSELQVIESSENKRSIRAKRLTDRESNLMRELEFLRAQERVDKFILEIIDGKTSIGGN